MADDIEQDSSSKATRDEMLNDEQREVIQGSKISTNSAEILSHKEYWHPLEEKEFPEYITKRFRDLNLMHNLDFTSIERLLQDPNYSREDIALYLNCCIEETDQAKLSTEQKTKALAILQSFLTEDADQYMRESVVNALGNLGEPAIETLNKVLSREPDLSVCEATVYALGNIGEPALSDLRILAGDKDTDELIREAAIWALGNLGEPALETLQTLTKTEELNIREASLSAISKIEEKFKTPKLNHHERIYNLVASQEPALLNPIVKEHIYNPENLEQNPLFQLNDIVQTLREKYPTELVGLVILGSLSKGYWTPESDIDWGLIFNNNQTIISTETIEKAKIDFQNLAEKNSFRLCKDHSLDASSINQEDYSSFELVFNGLFFGDREQLLKIQKNILNNIDENDWRMIQDIWIENLENYEKMSERFDLTPLEARLVKGLRNFLWHLPDFETMKKEFATQET